MVDLGCGRGDSVDVFRAADPAVRWLGLDLEGSREFAERTRDGRRPAGLRRPHASRAPDASVDVVFCKQVLEHVERPEPLLADVARVLRPGGAFAGSTSHLEPFHSRSVANYTPYGLKLLLERAGLELEAVLPGHRRADAHRPAARSRVAPLRPLVDAPLAAQRRGRRAGPPLAASTPRTATR